MCFLIGELAAWTGEDVRSPRFCSDRGLLRAERGENTYRKYEPDVDFGAALQLFETNVNSQMKKLVGAGQKKGCTGYSTR